MPRDTRRVGFHLPPEVFNQLLDEVAYDDFGEEEGFWDRLRSYYELSILEGDTVICHPSFVEFVAEYEGTDPPTWVSQQSTLPQMQCLIVAGPLRGAALLETLKAIAAMRASCQEEDADEHDGYHETG